MNFYPAIDRLATRDTRTGKLLRRAGIAFLLALAGLNLLTAWLFGQGVLRGLAPAALLLIACGFLVAAVFAYAALEQRPDQRRIISPLYSADLLGGCLGSLAASLFLIPLAGLSVSTALMGAVALLALILV